MGEEIAAYQVSVPLLEGEFDLTIELGRSMVVVGANGAGKTRLGVFIEDRLPKDRATRVSAHRSLTMSENISAIGLERALSGLHYGSPDSQKKSHKYQGKAAVALINDFDFLLQALFAEMSRTAVRHLEAHTGNPTAVPPTTIVARLKRIWEYLLPHRRLTFNELSISVDAPGTASAEEMKGYPGSQMSDGERVMFYLIGQCLLAPPSSVIIIDEPELHIHKAILARFWDAIEAERSDCAFVYITHDLDFATARPTARKLCVFSYRADPRWELDALPQDTGLPERIATELVGSRQPVLFVEGARNSLDAMIFRCAYPHMLVEPVGSAHAVVHAVSTFAKNTRFHRLGAVCGIVDADSHSAEKVEWLLNRSIWVLPVAEIENILLLPSVYRELGRALHFTESDLDSLQRDVDGALLREAERERVAASIRFASRRLDEALKWLAPSAKSAALLATEFRQAVASLDPESLAREYDEALAKAISSHDLTQVLALLDHKGLLSIGAQHLGLKGRDELCELAGRLLAVQQGSPLNLAVQKLLPSIEPQKQIDVPPHAHAPQDASTFSAAAGSALMRNTA